IEQLHQPRHADFAGEQAARNIAGRVLAAIRAEPAGDSIDIDAEGAENLLLAAAGSRHGAGAVRGVAALRRHQRSRLIARSGRRAISCANSANGWTSMVIGHGCPIQIMLLNRHGPDTASADGKLISLVNSPTL